MTTIFIDTGPFIARFLERDQYHRKSIQVWKSLAGKNLVTSNFVLDEFFTYLARNSSYSFAAERARSIYSSEAVEIIESTIELEQTAINFFSKFADQQVSFTDCVSFSIMNDRKIRKAFSFDRHFTQAGFELLK